MFSDLVDWSYVSDHVSRVPRCHLCYYSLGNSVRVSAGMIQLNIEQISYRRDNIRRDKLYGKSTPDAKVDTYELADKVCKTHSVGAPLIGCFLGFQLQICSLTTNELCSWNMVDELFLVYVSVIFSACA
jgi:hypothetical protein